MKILLYGRAKKIVKNIEGSKELKKKKVIELSQGEIIPTYLWPFNI